MRIITELSTVFVLILVMITSAVADPNMQELVSAKVLVGETAPTGGGQHPTLSPDGNMLAFCSTGGRKRGYIGLWILRGIGSDKPEILQVEGEKYWPQGMQWSPDSKILNFWYEGELYAAEDFDFQAKTVKVRKLENTNAVEHSILSPDGKKIVFLRGTGSSNPSKVVIKNLVTGKETIVANDADDGFRDTWGQPWLPDSKHVLYAAREHGYVVRDGGQHAITRTGIKIASVDGSKPKVFLRSQSARWPSCCPGKNSIIYVDDGLKLTDNKANKPRRLTRPIEEAKEEMATVKSLVAETSFERSKAFTNGISSDESPIWSPDGRKIVCLTQYYEWNSPQRNVVRLIDVPTGKVTNVFVGDRITELSWGADSRHIIFVNQRCISCTSNANISSSTYANQEIWWLKLK